MVKKKNCVIILTPAELSEEVCEEDIEEEGLGWI